jgi:hypothetical protein
MTQILKRTLQTALVWTLYEELYPRLSRLGSTLASYQKPSRRGGVDS